MAGTDADDPAPPYGQHDAPPPDYLDPPPSYEAVMGLLGPHGVPSCATCSRCHELIPLNDLNHNARCGLGGLTAPGVQRIIRTANGAGGRGESRGGRVNRHSRTRDDSISSNDDLGDEATAADSETGPSSHMCFSIIVCLCCNPVFGFIALGYSSMASEDKARGDFNAATNHAVKACWFNILGIFCTLFVAGAVLAALYLS